MSIRYFGLAAFRQAIDGCLDLVDHARARVDAEPELELVTEPSLGILTFRRRPPGVEDEDDIERINADLIARCEAEGHGFVSSTRLLGRYAVRLCILNHSTSRREVDDALGFFASAPVVAGAERPADADRDRNPAIEAGWLGRPRLDADTLRSLPLFTTLAKMLTIRGYLLFEITSNPQRLAKGKQFVFDGLASGALKPTIAKTFPLEKIVEAHRYLEGNSQVGKVVVTV